MKRINILCLLVLLIKIDAIALTIEQNGVYYNLDEFKKTALVTFKPYGDDPDGWMYYSATELYVGDVVIPEFIEDSEQKYIVIGADSYAFAGSKLLTSISFPKSFIQFKEGTFTWCNSLASFTFDIDNPVFFTHNNIIYRKNPLELFYVPRAISGAIELYNALTVIPSSSFQYCNSITTVRLPSNLQEIKDGAFANSSLKALICGEKVRNISNNAFFSCQQLEEVYLPNVRNIGNQSFSGCSKLNNLYLGRCLETIGSYAFSNCTDISTILLPNTLKTIDIKAFYGCVNLSTITNQSSLNIKSGSTDYGYVAFYATDVITGNIIETPYASSLDVFVKQNTLYISNAKDQNISIYDIHGRLVYNGICKDNADSVTLSEKGLYIIKIEQNIFKVICH